LIFICTTAGTTAIQEPKAYQTVTDGNTVTDGTAVFKAVSVSGQITQISKIGNLSSLNTTDKTSAVNAINEVNTKVSKTEVLISNSGDAYSASKAYAVGDYVIHDDKLYRCTTACSAGSWATNQSCFIQDTLVNVANKTKYKVNGNGAEIISGTIANGSSKSIKISKGLVFVYRQTTQVFFVLSCYDAGYNVVLGSVPSSIIITKTSGYLTINNTSNAAIGLTVISNYWEDYQNL
jgi:hypothetical protein